MSQAEGRRVTPSSESFSQQLFPILLMQITRITSETEVRHLVIHSQM